MEFESLIFDIDGTLWDSRALVAEGYNIQLRREGLDHLCTSAEELKPLFGKVMTEIGDILFASVPAPERYDLMERCMATENQYLLRLLHRRYSGRPGRCRSGGAALRLLRLWLRRSEPLLEVH